MKRRHVSVAASDIDATCWYALSNKARVHGPESIDWEVFQTSRESTGLWQGSQGERSIWAERVQAFGLLHAKFRSGGRDYKWLILGVRTSTTY
jgi:hypothetical protein